MRTTEKWMISNIYVLNSCLSLSFRNNMWFAVESNGFNHNFNLSLIFNSCTQWIPTREFSHEFNCTLKRISSCLCYLLASEKLTHGPDRLQSVSLSRVRGWMSMHFLHASLILISEENFAMYFEFGNYDLTVLWDCLSLRSCVLKWIN